MITLSRKSTASKPVGEPSDGDKPHVQTNQNIIWLVIYRGVVMGYNQSHGNSHGINNIGL